MDHKPWILLCLVLSCTGNDTKLKPICGNFGHNRCYGVWTEEFQDPQLDHEWEAERMRDRADWWLKYGNDARGICKFGRPTCDERGTILNCEGAVYPEYMDQCDGLDNDCDGQVDVDPEYPKTGFDWPYSKYSKDTPNPCVSQRGVCAQAAIKCKRGKWKCDFPDTYEEIETKCDGLNNDCDIFTDEAPITCQDPLGNEVACGCYEGPIGTDRYGTCRQGIVECINGQLECVGDIKPQFETCNDGLDNDCNGLVDDSIMVEAQRIDYVFIMDDSGSMCDKILAVGAACSQFVRDAEANPNHRFAIVMMSSFGTRFVTVDTDFTDLATVATRLETLGCDGSGLEASKDAAYDVCHKDNPLSLSWSEDSIRVALMFSDEPEHSYRAPQVEVQDIVNACQTSETLLFVWSPVTQEYEDMALQSNGAHFELVPDAEQIFSELSSIVVYQCIDEAE